MKLNLITTTYKDNVKKTVNENITFIKDDERENELTYILKLSTNR